MSLPLHTDTLDKLRPDRCERCHFWAQWMKERMLGTCGKHLTCCDKWESCEDFRKRDFNE